MTFFFTACSLLFALGSAFCAWIAYDQARELTSSRARITNNEHELDLLNAHIHKLRQKIYSTKHETKAIEIVQPLEQAEACENWLRAQTDGPSSKAAKCGCDYCIAKRNDRDSLRSRIVPKTATERRNVIEAGRKDGIVDRRDN